MIPHTLERLVLDGATSTVVQFGGGALSSIAIPSNRVGILWQLEIFPFFDVYDNALSALLLSQRSSHYIEFSDHRTRVGFLHRSNYSERNFPPAPPTFGPVDGPSIVPTYQIFDAEWLVCRIMHNPGAIVAVASSIPDANEGAVVAGYKVAPSFPVLLNFDGYGDGQQYFPDARGNTGGTNEINQPRPIPDSTGGDRTILELPRSIGDEMQQYSFPIINASIVWVTREAFDKMRIQIRHQMDDL